MVSSTATGPDVLPRDILASFLPNDRAIKAFESMSQAVADTIQSGDVDTIQIQAIMAGAQATAALDAIARLEELLGKEPAPQSNNSIATDYIDFAEIAPHASAKRRLAWNPIDQTLDLGMDHDVTQQIGLEAYVRVQNVTGSTIPNGSVVGFAGAGAGDVITVVPFIADGTMPAQALMGVMTHDLPDSGEVGYCTTFGHVRTLDTSAWAVGDPLYASTTVPGGMTNVRPTAPNIVSPVAAVLVSDATDGVIIVRPTLILQTYYATFVKTTDHVPAAINTAYPLVLDSAVISNGFSLGAPASRIVAAHAGLYLVTGVVQITSNSATQKNVWVWLRKNGTDIANSARLVTSDLNNGYVSVAFNTSVSLVIGDYIEVVFAADNVNVTIDAVASTAFAPASSAVIITLSQIVQ